MRAERDAPAYYSLLLLNTDLLLYEIGKVVFVIPGFMHAALTDALFWLGLGIILPAGYAVAYPAMYWAMKREQKRGMKAHYHH